MPARLAISNEEGLALELELGGRPVSIGRADGNTVRSADRRTSRHHVVVRRTADGGYVAEDTGSSYGTLLNGRPVQRERLAHMDVLTIGGLQVQFLTGDDEPVDGDGPTGVIPAAEVEQAERQELRAQVQALIEEQAGLRREIGRLEDDLRRAERERDAEREQAGRLQEESAELRAEIGRLQARIETLGAELRNERRARDAGGDDEAARRTQAEARRQSERQAAQLRELELREAQLAARLQELKKDNERLQELNQRREKREAELTQVVKPALARVAQLQDELEKMRIQLAQAQAELDDYRKGRR